MLKSRVMLLRRNDNEIRSRSMLTTSMELSKNRCTVGQVLAQVLRYRLLVLLLRHHELHLERSMSPCSCMRKPRSRVASST